MNTLHAKSPCCREKIYKYGNKRRQCSKCKKTWRIRQKHRGRKESRTTSKLLVRYLRHELPSLYAYSRAKNKSEDKLNRNLQKSLRYFLHHTTWPVIRGKVLIALADAMIINLNHKFYTFYFILLRETEETKAYVMPPYIDEGTESHIGWYKTFKRLPKRIQLAIKVLVCDGHKGLLFDAERRKWIIQRCHFHLLSHIQTHCSKKRTGRHYREGKLIYSIIKEILSNPQRKNIVYLLNVLKEIAKVAPSRQLRSSLRDFGRHYREFRHYLNYPRFNIPTTTNSIESLIGMVRALCFRARGFRTINSLTEWVHALLKHKKSVTCNGYFQPN